MSDLFPSAFQSSPKLQWLARYGLHTAKDALPRGFIGPADKPWRCSNAARTVNTFADSEEDAILCSQMGVRHWTVEQHMKSQPTPEFHAQTNSVDLTFKELDDHLTKSIVALYAVEQGIDFDE